MAAVPFSEITDEELDQMIESLNSNLDFLDGIHLSAQQLDAGATALEQAAPEPEPLAGRSKAMSIAGATELEPAAPAPKSLPGRSKAMNVSRSAHKRKKAVPSQEREKNMKEGSRVVDKMNKPKNKAKKKKVQRASEYEGEQIIMGKRRQKSDSGGYKTAVKKGKNINNTGESNTQSHLLSSTYQIARESESNIQPDSGVSENVGNEPGVEQMAGSVIRNHESGFFEACVYADAVDSLEKISTRSTSLYDAILEEIALEGLDGITLPSLLLRLSARLDQITSADDIKNSKYEEYIFRVAKRIPLVQIFELPESRRDLVIYRRYDCTDELGTCVEPLSIQDDIYEYFPIEDNVTGIMGSCKFYNERQDISGALMELKWPEVLGKYDLKKLVFVASQGERERMIFGSDPDVLDVFNVMQYCILERIGRARYEGEQTRGQVSLATMKVEAKNLFYQRKLLLQHQLIVKQPFFMKFGPSRVACSMTVFHLRRFYRKLDHPTLRNAVRIMGHIKDHPNKMVEMFKLKKLCGKNSIRFIHERLSDFFWIGDVPLAELNPVEFANEKNEVKRELMTKRTLKAVRLYDRNLDTKDLEAAIKYEEDEETTDKQQTFPERHVYFQDCTDNQDTLFFKIVEFIIKAGSRGVIPEEISENFNLASLPTRTVLRTLCRYGLLKSYMEDKHKTKVTRYVTTKYFTANRERMKLPRINVVGNAIATRPAEPNWIHDPTPSSFGIIEIPRLEVVDCGITLTNAKISTTQKPGLKPTSVVEDDAKSDDVDSDSNASQIALSIEELYSPGPLSMVGLRRKKLMKKKTIVLRKSTFKNVRLLPPDQANSMNLVPSENKEPIVYEHPEDWQVLIQESSVFINAREKFSHTTRTLKRCNLIMTRLTKEFVIIGMRSLLQSVRMMEKDDSSGAIADRRSLRRLIKILNEENKLLVWKITVSKGPIIRSVAALTNTDLSTSSCENMLKKVTEFLIQSLERITKIVKRQKQLSFNKRRLFSTSQQKSRSAVFMKKKKRANRTTRIRRPRKVRPVASYAAQLEPGADADVINKLGKRRYYDVKDLEALSKMKKQRVDWSTREDRHVLFLFVASVLFVPRYNLQKIYIFNAPQIRELLHEKLERSRTKTSIAVRRRIHFLMKSKTFSARYRYYIHSAMNDEELYESILGPYIEKAKSSQKLYDTVPMEPLREVFNYLWKKWTDPSQSQDEAECLASAPTWHDLTVARNKRHGDDLDKVNELLQTLVSSDDEFEGEGTSFSKSKKSLFRPVHHFEDEDEGDDNFFRICRSKQSNLERNILYGQREPDSIDELGSWVARTAVLSLLFSGDTILNVHSFLECVPDPFFEFVVNSLRKMGVITVARGSQRYSLTAQIKRKLAQNATPAAFRLSQKMLEILRSDTSLNGEEYFQIGAIHCLLDLWDSDINLSLAFPESVLTVRKQWKTVCNYLLQDEFADGRHQRIERRKHLLQGEEVEEESHQVPGPSRSSKTCSPKKKGAKDVLRELDKMANAKDAGGDCDLDVDFEEDQYFYSNDQQINPQSSPNASCRNPGSESEISHSETSASQFPQSHFEPGRQAMKVLRRLMNNEETVDDNRECIDEKFNINLPKAIVHIQPSKLAFLDDHCRKIQTSIKTNMEKFHIKIIPSMLFNIKRNVLEGMLGRYYQIYEVIEFTGESGISISYLREHFTEEVLTPSLNYLLNWRFIFIVGITQRRLISAEHVFAWTMPVPKSPGSKETHRVIIRPWITSQGDLNWKLLDALFVAIFGYLQNMSCLRVEEVGRLMSPLLSSVETMLLLQSLFDIKIIQFYEITESNPISLFSKPTKLKRKQVLDPLLTFENLNVEIVPKASILYSEIQKVLNSLSELDEECIQVPLTSASRRITLVE